MFWQLISCPRSSHFDLRITELKFGQWEMCTWNHVKRMKVFPEKLKISFMNSGEWDFQILVIHLWRMLFEREQNLEKKYMPSPNWIALHSLRTDCTFLPSSRVCTCCSYCQSSCCAHPTCPTSHQQANFCRRAQPCAHILQEGFLHPQAWWGGPSMFFRSCWCPPHCKSYHPGPKSISVFLSCWFVSAM